jgi:Ca-activated chloride channel family protein
MTNAQRKFRLLVLGLLVTTPILAQDASKPFSLSVNVDLVELHVTVVDGKQRPIGGLIKENFRILENKIEQPIAVFKQEDVPISLGLILDNSRSIEPRKERLDAAALSFVRKSNPDDETFVVHFDFNARLSQDFSMDGNLLRRTLRSEKPYGQTAIYDAVSLALDTMARAKYEKKALLLVTDGIDNHSVTSYPELIEKVKRTNVAIYVVGLLSVSGGLAAEDTLIEIAEASGGRAYFPQTSEHAGSLMEQIARDLREQYTIGYFPTNPLRDGEWRSVRVEITPPKGLPANLDVSYRRGYYAPSQMADKP